MRISDWSSDVCSSDLYDPRVARPDSLLKILRDIGYTISDPRKVRPFEEEERDLVREGRRFLIATALSLLAIGLITSSSEERRVGKEWVSPCRYRWSPYHLRKKMSTIEHA